MSRLVQMRWPDGLVEQVDAKAGPGNRTAWVVRAVERALEQAQAVDTQAGSPAGRRSATSTRVDASATGAVPARGASRPSAPARALNRAEMFRNRAQS